MRPEQKAEFREFAATRMTRLRDLAYLQCGDWHRAEDAVQVALVKLYAAWPRATKTSPDGYVRRILVNTLIDEHRRARYRRERSTAELPERVQREPDLNQRLTVLAALERLSPRRRATLLLRFWEDQTVEQTARIMRCSPNIVKSQTVQGLRALRGLLAETLPEPA